MNREKQVKNLLCKKFEHRRVNSVINHFFACVQKFEGRDWENSLIKAGKFVEATVKMIWIYCRKSLPTRARDFKAGLYAQKIINEVNKQSIPHDEIRLQIPRASIFIYDIASNRGARHDPEELDPNEMDTTVVISTCSWILAELIRFSAKSGVGTNEAKEIVDSLMERRYPSFEEIDGQIYIDRKKYKSAPECAVLILYKLYPKRIDKKSLVDSLKSHGFKKTALKLERLRDYVHIDKNSNILLRATGRQRAEQILNRKN